MSPFETAWRSPKAAVLALCPTAVHYRRLGAFGYVHRIIPRIEDVSDVNKELGRASTAVRAWRNAYVKLTKETAQ